MNDEFRPIGQIRAAVSMAEGWDYSDNLARSRALDFIPVPYHRDVLGTMAWSSNDGDVYAFEMAMFKYIIYGINADGRTVFTSICLPSRVVQAVRMAMVSVSTYDV